MNRITETAGASVITLLMIMSVAQITFAASEVQGTLSSDGSSGATQQSSEAGGNASVGTTLSGTVMGGSENDDDRRMTALAGFMDDRSMLGLMSILIPLSLIAIGAGFFFLGKRVRA